MTSNDTEELFLEQDIRDIYREMAKRSTSIGLARKKDIDSISNLLKTYIQKNVVLDRSKKQIEEDLPFTYVIKTHNRVIAVMNFSFYLPNLAEIRGLVVEENFHRMGIGQKLMNFAINDLRLRKSDLEKQNINTSKLRLFALTYQPQFFLNCITMQDENGSSSGRFTICEKNNFPQKIYEVCQFCSKQDDCQEIAVESELEIV